MLAERIQEVQNKIQLKTLKPTRASHRKVQSDNLIWLLLLPKLFDHQALKILDTAAEERVERGHKKRFAEASRSCQQHSRMFLNHGKNQIRLVDINSVG